MLSSQPGWLNGVQYVAVGSWSTKGSRKCEIFERPLEPDRSEATFPTRRALAPSPSGKLLQMSFLGLLPYSDTMQREGAWKQHSCRDFRAVSTFPPACHPVIRSLRVVGKAAIPLEKCLNEEKCGDRRPAVQPSCCEGESCACGESEFEAAAGRKLRVSPTTNVDI